MRLVTDAAKVKATIGSRQMPSSTVFSVTQRSRKPNSSARRATAAIVVSANGSGERCGNDMPRAVLSRKVMGPVFLASGSARGDMAVSGPLEAEVLAQGTAFVLGAEQAAALQFRRNHLHEVLASARQVGGSNVEAIAGVILEPVLHDIGDVSWRSYETEATHARHFLVELPDGRVLLSHTLEQLGADAAQLCRPELVERNGIVEGVGRQVPKRLVEPRQTNERIEQLLQLIVLCSCFSDGPADDRTQRGQDLQVFGAASILLQASLDVGVERLRH